MAPVEMGSPSDLSLDAVQSGGQNLEKPHRSSECPEWQLWVRLGRVDSLARARIRGTCLSSASSDLALFSFGSDSAPPTTSPARVCAAGAPQ